MKIKELYESPKLELVALLSADNIATASTIVDPNPDDAPETPDIDVD